MVFYTESSQRIFTDYRPSCERDDEIKKRYNLKSNAEFRAFLQTNATKLMADQAAAGTDASTKSDEAMCSCADCNPPQTLSLNTSSKCTIL